MSKDEFKKQLLRKLINEKGPNVLGDIEYFSSKYNFYEFEKSFDVSKSFYEETILEMRREGLIEIELNGYNDLKHAIIFATKQGVEQLIKEKTADL